MRKETLISVSTLPAEKNIYAYIKKIEKTADFLHCDIMDGTITPKPNLLNYNDFKEINSRTTLPLDVHLMVRNPAKYISKYIKSGANIISIHIENFTEEYNFIQLLTQIKKSKVLCGIALDLNTDISKVEPFLPYCDLVLLMSVNIGASGQKFNESVMKKIKFLKEIKREKDYNFLIEVDGGINPENSAKLIRAGADILVSGSYVFNENGSHNAIMSLKKVSKNNNLS